MIGLSFWVRFDGEITEWVDKLHIQQFYTGLYILIVCSFVLMGTGFLSCIGTFSENIRLLAVVRTRLFSSYNHSTCNKNLTKQDCSVFMCLKTMNKTM